MLVLRIGKHSIWGFDVYTFSWETLEPIPVLKPDRKQNERQESSQTGDVSTKARENGAQKEAFSVCVYTEEEKINFVVR